jgi:hypothetical protein
MAHLSRGRQPRAFSKARERGRRKGCEPVATQGSLVMAKPCSARTPASVAAVPRVRSHRQRLQVQPCRAGTGHSHRQDLERLRSHEFWMQERRCRRASVQSVALLHSLGRGPRPMRELLLCVRRPDGGRLPQPGTAPAPRHGEAMLRMDAAQLLRPMWAGVRASMADADGAGTSSASDRSGHLRLLRSLRCPLLGHADLLHHPGVPRGDFIPTACCASCAAEAGLNHLSAPLMGEGGGGSGA